MSVIEKFGYVPVTDNFEQKEDLPRIRLIDGEEVKDRFNQLHSQDSRLADIAKTMAFAPEGNYVMHKGAEITRIQMYSEFVVALDTYGEQFEENERTDQKARVLELISDMQGFNFLSEE